MAADVERQKNKKILKLSRKGWSPAFSSLLSHNPVSFSFDFAPELRNDSRRPLSTQNRSLQSPSSMFCSHFQSKLRRRRSGISQSSPHSYICFIFIAKLTFLGEPLLGFAGLVLSFLDFW